jgi:hypothetical protein
MSYAVLSQIRLSIRKRCDKPDSIRSFVACLYVAAAQHDMCASKRQRPHCLDADARVAPGDYSYLACTT